jgi:flagellar biosynthesis chaperone FliJ
MILRLLTLLVATTIFSGCSMFTRSRCEKINWFERGQSLALRGQYPQSDAQLKECRKVKAEIDEGQLDLGFKRGRELYCTPERAFLTGKEGNTFATDICDQSLTRSLLRKHAEGVRGYCTPESGKQLGASGKDYNSICPADLEVAFKSAYSKARRGYLEGLIPGLQQQIQQKQNQISSAKSQLMFLQGQKIVYSAQLASAQARNSAAPETAHLQSQVGDLESKISQQNNIIRSGENEINAITSRISNIQGEIAGLKD